MPTPRRPHRWGSSNRKQELPPNWKTLREEILVRDGRQCTWVDEGVRCPIAANQVDHIRRGSDHRSSNLRSLCESHHSTKSSYEGWDELRRLKAQAKANAERRFGHQEEHPGKKPAETFKHPWAR